jgi:N-acyl-D-aspartate/D-glutamate deacylase
MPTFLLTHWVRDRQRGRRLSLERAVQLQTSETAAIYGFDDRGTIEVGKRADLNIIDFDRLDPGLPEMHYDLPTGAKRFLQKPTGYVATIVAGQIVWDNGRDTGARPGRLIRAGRAGQAGACPPMTSTACVS